MKTAEEILKEHGIVLANCDCANCQGIKTKHLAAMEEYAVQFKTPSSNKVSSGKKAEGEREQINAENIEAGTRVRHEGVEYTTGNSGHGVVELYQGKNFYGCIPFEDLTIVTP